MGASWQAEEKARLHRRGFSPADQANRTGIKAQTSHTADWAPLEAPKNSYLLTCFKSERFPTRSGNGAPIQTTTPGRRTNTRGASARGW